MKKTEQNNSPKILAKYAGISEKAAEFLCKRGIDSPEKYKEYFFTRLSSVRDVNKMRDAQDFLDILSRAIDDKKEITIYGDYDCDGIMATSIFLLGLKKLSKAPVNWFINDRFKEGYGMNEKGVLRLLDTYPSTQLIVTVDNGIKAVGGVRMAIDRGVDVIISDHHKQSSGDLLPACPVVCEGRIDEPEELKEYFCGAELARRLISQLYINRGIAKQNSRFLNGLCAYSGFATITDSVPMNWANHEIARVGLKMIQLNYDPLWKNLNMKMEPYRVNQDTIGFTYGPMFNAPGRVRGNVDASMDVILTSHFGTTEEASAAIDKLIEINEERKNWSKEDDALAFEMAAMYEGDKFLILASESFREGINGLTASHLTEHYQVPAIVLSPIKGNENIYKGSGRSVDLINLFGLLEQSSDLMEGFGGHPMAAGISVKKENIDLLRKRLNEITPENKNKGKTNEDFECDTSDISLNLIHEFQKFEPYGEKFEKPLFKLNGSIENMYFMKDKHIKFNVSDGNNGNILQILWWNSVEYYNSENMDLKSGDSLTCIGTPESNVFNNCERIQMVADKISFNNQNIKFAN